MAGVSPAAVSRYLNGGPVSEEKKERIRAAIEQTGFQPNTMARTMRTGQGNEIGIIAPRIDSESTSEILAGVSDQLQGSGYGILLGVSGEQSTSGGQGNQEVQCIGTMQTQQVAGIILMGTVMTPELRDAIQGSRKPIVVTGQNFADCSCVCHSDYESMKELTRRMIRRGRRQIAYIGVFEEDRAAGFARRRGAEDAWKEETGGQMPLMRVTADGFRTDSGRRAMEKLLQRDPLPDGVVCASDQIAIGAMTVIRGAGLRVPEDISVAGVGDSWADAATAPPLTTVHLYYRQCGREAADLLLRQIRFPKDTRPEVIRLGYEIIERESM